MMVFRALTGLILAGLGFTLLTGSPGKSQTKAEPETVPAPQKSTPYQSHSASKYKSSSSSLRLSKKGPLNPILEKYRHLDEYFRLMDQHDVDSEMAQSLKKLRGRPNILKEVTELNQSLTRLSQSDGQNFVGEARWRTVYLLGELRDPLAKKALFEIASSPLPDPEKVSEGRFKEEYRIRLRAIDGLEKLKEVELLERLYRDHKLLMGPVAASLYELGHAPKGVVKVDPIQVIGYGDPTGKKSVTGRKSVNRTLKPTPAMSVVKSQTTIVRPSSKGDR